MSDKKAFTVELLDNDHYQSLLKCDGKLLTDGMHAGRVHLEPGGECGLHNTQDKEELLVFLKGTGIAEIAGQESMSVGAGKVAYIPAQTEHNIKNTGDGSMQYVFCVAPVSKYTLKG